jgi:outer membrane PBP1 activator LpoA protein
VSARASPAATTRAKWGGKARWLAQAAEKPHIAVLLPLDSPAFGKLADAVKRGIEAAASTAEPDKTLPIVVYPTNDVAKSIVDIYDRAVRAGAQFVIGPLTKNAVQAIAASNAVTVPTLGLSVPDSEGTLPANMYAFGVQIEAEARQIARVAHSQGKRRAVVITGDNTLAKRASQAFMDEWTRSGRLIVDQHAYTTDQGKLKRIRDSLGPNNVDAIFLALDGQRARQVRPYIGKTVAMYATSQINSTEGTVLGQHDLNGVVFLDMPWMVLPDHPAVMSYPRLTGVFGTFEQDRFYAMSVKWDYNRYLIGKAVELFSVGEVGKPLEGVADYTLDAEVGLRYKVTDWASLNMKAEKDIVSGAEGDLDETRYTLGFGVGW